MHSTKLLYSIISVLLIAGCNKEKKPFLILDSPSTISFEAEGGEQKIFFQTDENWIIDCSGAGDCFSVFPDKGIADKESNYITVTCERNGWYESKSLLITIMTSTNYVTINVNQAGDKIVSFKDERFKRALLDEGKNIDRFRDNEITYYEAELTLGLSTIPDFGIQSCEGIEFFKNITFLGISKNPITEIDISNNSMLENVDIVNTSLSCLDLRNNVALKRLQVSENSLSSLDLSNNILLEETSCVNNKMTNLIFGENAHMFILNCWDNELTSLDVRKLSSLQYLYCNNNQLSLLDVSNLQSLIHLRCDNNKLTSLDVSNVPSLQILDCASNNLSFLDLTNNHVLESLYCNGNPSLKEVWIASGQKVNISYDHSTTNIVYK